MGVGRLPPPPPNDCTNPGFGKPIRPTTGNETYRQATNLNLGGQSLQLDYDSIYAPWAYEEGYVEDRSHVAFGDWGKLWWSNFHKRLIVNTNNLSVQAIRGGAQIIGFNAASPDTPWRANADQLDTLENLPEWKYLYRDQSDLNLEVYYGDGDMERSVRHDGMSLTTTYRGRTWTDRARLLALTDPFGRKIKFTYKTLATGDVVIDTITDPALQNIVAGYDDDGNLTSLTWQDGKVRSFVYDSAHPDQRWALTGIVDENNKRHAAITYDASGWAKSTENAGGVNKYIINYTTPPQKAMREVDDIVSGVMTRNHEWIAPTGTTVTQPNGTVLDLLTTSALGETAAQGSPRAAGFNQPAGAGCAASTSEQTFDSRGNIDRRDDFNGKRVCHAYESSRNFETARVEGLSGGVAGTSCSAALSAANVSTLAPEARKISTEWHPDWKLETRRAEPGQITTWVYNGQPDPFNNGADATCAYPRYGAASVDTLPDGKPIAVLCKQVVQSTTDVNGSQGFAATMQTPDPATPWQVVSRSVSYTYNQFGQVLTSTDERGQVTDYVYHDTTTANYTKGDLWKVTNALGHVTEYTQYNPHGQVLQVLDPNGVATSYTYDLRQRLKSVTQAGQLTQIDWWPTGLLKKVTQPDGSWLFYDYDDAHRLTDIADNLGNSVHYELDNAGNRKQEQVKDSTGLLTRQIDRNYDALNRLHKTSTGAPF